jgi:hypothetical protein
MSYRVWVLTHHHLVLTASLIAGYLFPAYSSGAQPPQSQAPMALTIPELPSLTAEEPEIMQVPPTGITLDDLVDKTATEGEQRIQRVVEEALAAKEKSGAWRRLQNKKLIRLAAPEARRSDEVLLLSWRG